MRLPRMRGMRRFKRGMDSAKLTGIEAGGRLPRRCFYSAAILASSGSITGISSRTGYTRLQVWHFKPELPGVKFTGVLHTGQTKISSSSWEIAMSFSLNDYLGFGLWHCIKGPGSGQTASSACVRVRSPTASDRLGPPMARPNDKQTIREHYDAVSPYYRSLWGEHIHHGYWVRGDESKERAQLQLIEHLAQLANVKPGLDILDIGCGMGASSLHLARTYHVQATGITISPVQVE